MLLSTALNSQIKFEQASFQINEQCGLGSTEAYHVLKDSKENLWISTDMGLVKYDGFNSTTFSTKNGLSSNVIFKAYEDPFGRIWALSIRNELHFIQNDTVYAYPHNDVLNKLIPFEDNLLKQLVITKDSTVHFSVGVHGSFSIDKKGELINHHSNEAYLEIQPIEDEFLLTCKNEQFAKNTIRANKRLKINGSYKSKLPYLKHLQYSKPSDLSHLKINRQTETLEGLALISSYVISFPSGKVLDSNVTALEHVPSSNEYWVGKYSKVFRVALRDNSFQKIQNTTLLRNSYISSIHADQQGNTWFTTLERGIVYLPQYKVHHLTDENGNKIEKEVISFAVNADKLVLSYKDHIVDYSTQKAYNSDHSKLEFQKDQLIVSNILNKQWKAALAEDIHPFFTVHARDLMIEDSMLYGSSSSLYSYNIKDKSFQPIFQNTDKIRFFSQLCKFNDTLFVTSKNQLFKIKQKELIEVHHFGFKEITDMIQYKDMLLISTKNYGIFKYQEGLISPFLNIKNGLFNERVNTLTLSSNQRYLYIGCFKGLEIYDLLTDNCINISLNQGFTNLKVNQIREFDNQIYIAAEKGFYKLSYEDLRKLSSINTNSELSPTVTQLRVDGENYDNFISLPVDAKILSIAFQVRDLNNWFNKKYQYQINKGEWVTIYTPEIVLTNPRKKLQINLRYFMNNNAWSEPMPLIEGKVREPFYKSIFFYIFLFSALGLILFAVLRSKSNRKIKKLELENQMLSYQQRMQNARMKPHFIFNVLNSIHSFILFNENKSAANYLLKFSQLMRNILENSNDEKVKIHDEKALLENYLELENLRHENGFKYSVSLNGFDKFLEIPTIMIQPFVENAIIHGLDEKNENSEIQVDFNLVNKDIVEVCIFNTGTTSKNLAEKLYNSDDNHAVGITLSRIANYNERLHNDHYKMEVFEQEKGTTIKLYIPIL